MIIYGANAAFERLLFRLIYVTCFYMAHVQKIYQSILHRTGNLYPVSLCDTVISVGVQFQDGWNQKLIQASTAPETAMCTVSVARGQLHASPFCTSTLSSMRCEVDENMSRVV